MDESTTTVSKKPRSYSSFTLRELLLWFAVVAFVLLYFMPRRADFTRQSNAPFSLMAPIEYRYWHQRGPSGSGTGQIGTGVEWQPAIGIEVFDHFVILHVDDDTDRMIQCEGLQWLDWRRVDRAINIGKATPTSSR